MEFDFYGLAKVSSTNLIMDSHNSNGDYIFSFNVTITSADEIVSRDNDRKSSKMFVVFPESIVLKSQLDEYALMELANTLASKQCQLGSIISEPILLNSSEYEHKLAQKYIENNEPKQVFAFETNACEENIYFYYSQNEIIGNA